MNYLVSHMALKSISTGLLAQPAKTGQSMRANITVTVVPAFGFHWTSRKQDPSTLGLAMRFSVLLSMLILCGVAMAGQNDSLQERETGSYAEISHRPNPHKLVFLFMPSLVSTLLANERKNGSPLSQKQVEAIRDSATITTAPPEAAKAVGDGRGYQDIDPHNAWREWSAIRVQFSR